MAGLIRQDSHQLRLQGERMSRRPMSDAACIASVSLQQSLRNQ